MSNNTNGNGYVPGGYVPGGYVPTTMTTFPLTWSWRMYSKRKLIKKKERRDWEEAIKRYNISDVTSTINLSQPIGKLCYMDII